MLNNKIDEKILEQIPKRYRNKHEIQSAILDEIKVSKDNEAGISSPDLYVFVCNKLGKQPKWTIFQNHLRTLVQQGLVKKLKKTSFQCVETAEDGGLLA